MCLLGSYVAPQPFMSSLITVLIQVTLHMFFILQYLTGLPLLCNLCLDILPYISPCSPLRWIPFLLNTALIPYTTRVSVTFLFNDLPFFHYFFLPCCLYPFTLLIRHMTCHSDLRIFINIFDTPHFSSSMFYAHIQPFITGLHAFLSSFFIILSSLLSCFIVKLQTFMT